MVFYKGEIIADGDHGMEGQPEYNDDDENYYEKLSEWNDSLVFQIAEAMGEAMDAKQSSLF
jgi:hypothetical protein